MKRLTFDQRVNLVRVLQTDEVTLDAYGDEAAPAGETVSEAYDVPASVVQKPLTPEQLRGGKPEERVDYVVTLRYADAWFDARATHRWRVLWLNESLTLYVQAVVPKRREKVIDLLCSVRT